MSWFQSVDMQYKVALIGVLATAIMSAVNLIYSIRNNKSVHYIETITCNRIEWIGELRELVSKFVNLCSINYCSKDSIIEDDEHYREILRCSSKIKLMLNFNDNIDREIISIVEKLRSEIYDLKIVLNCIEEVELNGLEEETLSNPFFHEVAIRYAEFLNIQPNNREKYINNPHEITNLFMEMIHNKEEMEEFLGYMFDRPEEIMLDIEKNISDLCKKVQIYLKSEWNRVKYESRGKIYEKETQEFDIWELEQKYENPNYKNNVWKRFCIDLKAKIRRIWNSAEFAVFIFLVCIIVLIIIA